MTLEGLGIGYSSPAVTSDRIYITGMDESTGYIFAFELAAQTDYFLVKNATRMALFENLADINWGVFDTASLSGAMNLPTEDFTISHVSQFNSTSVPEPGMVGLLAIGLLGVVVARRKAKV